MALVKFILYLIVGFCLICEAYQLLIKKEDPTCDFNSLFGDSMLFIGTVLLFISMH